MKVIDLINNSKGTAFSFEILPPLKGTGIEKLYQTIPATPYIFVSQNKWTIL